MRFSLPVLLVAFAATTSAAEIPIVADGSARAVVALSENATPVARYAAEEFVHHVQKATGVKLAVVSEKELPSQPAGRVFIGDGDHARKAGIEASKLSPETFVLRTRDSALFIVGGDGEGEPLDVNTPAGTLFGVYEALERAL
ncbi:MAG: hypothetical protein FJ278_19935, partial [Planctomycetes bacterium]|nr:hypothetical protein [Planctomycetota bacterium]